MSRRKYPVIIPIIGLVLTIIFGIIWLFFPGYLKIEIEPLVVIIGALSAMYTTIENWKNRKDEVAKNNQRRKRLNFKAFFKKGKFLYATAVLVLLFVLGLLWLFKIGIEDCSQNSLHVYNFSNKDDYQFSRNLYNKLKTSDILSELIEVDYIDKNVQNDDQDFICIESGVRVYGDIRPDVGNFQCVVQVLNMDKCQSKLLADTLILIEEPNQFTLDMVGTTSQSIYSLLMGLMFYYNCDNIQTIRILSELLKTGNFNGQNRNIAYLYLANALFREQDYLTAIRIYDLIPTREVEDYTRFVISNREVAKRRFLAREDELSSKDTICYYEFQNNEFKSFANYWIDILEDADLLKRNNRSQSIEFDSLIFTTGFAGGSNFSIIPKAGSILSKTNSEWSSSLSQNINHKPLIYNEFSVTVPEDSLTSFFDSFMKVRSNELPRDFEFLQDLSIEMKNFHKQNSQITGTKTELTQRDIDLAKKEFISSTLSSNYSSDHFLVTRVFTIDKIRIANRKIELTKGEKDNSKLDVKSDKRFQNFSVRTNREKYQYVFKNHKILDNEGSQVFIVEFKKLENSNSSDIGLFSTVNDIYFTPSLMFIQAIPLDDEKFSDIKY